MKVFGCSPANVGGDAIETYKDGSLATNKLVPEGAENVPSNSSLMPANLNSLTKCREGKYLGKPLSNVFTLLGKTTKGTGDKEEFLRPGHH